MEQVIEGRPVIAVNSSGVCRWGFAQVGDLMLMIAHSHNGGCCLKPHREGTLERGIQWRVVQLRCTPHWMLLYLNPSSSTSRVRSLIVVAHRSVIIHDRRIALHATSVAQALGE